MKCPKCRYLSFEPELRCKHCGFDFSMADDGPSLHTYDELEQQDPDVPMVDLQLRMDEPEIPEIDDPRPSPMPAPVLRRPGPASRAVAATATSSAAPVAVAERILQDRPKAPALAPALARPLPAPTSDLPLFIKGVVIPETAEPEARDGEPARLEGDEEAEDVEFHVPAAPRPLVVRRRAPDTPRPAPVAIAATRALPINRTETDLLDYVRRVESEAAPASLPARVVSPPPRVNVTIAPATSIPEPVAGEVDAFARLQAAALDFVILAMLNIAVLLLTLRQLEMSIAQIADVPALPLLGFMASITVGYLLSFSVVNGQTIGKMVFGLRVVADEAGSPTPRQMSYRALLSVPCVLLLGLGFLPGLIGEGRAVHDRLTHTRVVRE